MIKNLIRYKEGIGLGEKTTHFNKFVYDISKNSIWLFSKIFILFNIKINYLEKIPESGPVVIVSSHKHWLDIPLLCLINKRYLRYVAKKELYKNSFFSWYLDSTGCISITRGQNDKEAIEKIVGALKQDEVVMIFPEGTRHKGEGLGELNNGIAVMLLRNKIYPPIYPMVITYQTGFLFGFPLKINITIGKKIDPSKSRKINELMDEIRNSMLTLLNT